MLRRFLIRRAQRTRFAMYNEAERLAVENLRSRKWDLAGLGAGVVHALNETRAHTGQWTIREIGDPFSLSAELAWRCEEAALQSAALGKQLGSMTRVSGGYLVASIFGLRVMAQNADDSVFADRVRHALPPKLGLARQAFIAYQTEVAEISRAQVNDTRYLSDGGDDVRDIDNPFR